MTTGATGILIRWKHGTVYVGDSSAREIFVNMAGVKTKKQAKTLGEKLLAAQRQVRNTTAYSGLSWYQLWPDFGTSTIPNVGSTMGGEHLAGITASLSGDHVEIVPELTDALTLRQEDIMRQIERAGAGTVSLWGSTLTNPADPQQGDGFAPVEFTVDGPLIDLFTVDEETGERPDRTSPVWRTKAPWRGSYMGCSLHIPGESTTRVDLIAINENLTTNTYTEKVISTCYIGKDKRYDASRIAKDHPGLKAGECLVARVVSAGVKAAKLTVTLHGGSV